jgi:translation initiation factor 1 (eIF-1/SUI1)
MLAQAGKTTSRKRKAVTIVEVVAVHELDSDNDDDEVSGKCGTGNASTVSELSSQPAKGLTL